MVKAFKGVSLCAYKGVYIVPTTREGQIAIQNQLNSSSIDKLIPEIEDRIRDFRGKARAIDEGRSKIQPRYDLKYLMRDDLSSLESKFKTLEKISVEEMPLSICSKSKSSYRSSIGDRGSDIFLEEIDVVEPVETYFVRFRLLSEQKEAETLPPINEQEFSKEKLPISPTIVDEKPIPKHGRNIVSSKTFHQPLTIDGDISLDTVPIPPVVDIPNSFEEEEEEEIQMLVKKQLDILNKDEKPKLLFSKSMFFTYNDEAMEKNETLSTKEDL